MMGSDIEVGKGVILKKGKNLKYVCISENKVEKMENFFFSCKDMIGKPFGTAFKVVDKKCLEVIDPVLVEDNCEEYENVNESLYNLDDDVAKDNRSIIDTAASQKLSKDDIMSLRDTGKTGEEIVQELIDNNATFKDRTEFSKAKYLKKKKKKYIAQFVALRPSARLLSELYFFKSPGKILDMRKDSLAQVLTYSNVQANSNVLLMETCQGFVAGALMERLGEGGNMVQIYQGSFPVRIIMEQYNFSVEERNKKVSSFPMEKLACLQELFSGEHSDVELLEYILGKASVQYPNKDINMNTQESVLCNTEKADTSTDTSNNLNIKTEEDVGRETESNLNIKTENVDCEIKSNLNIKTEEDVGRETENNLNIKTEEDVARETESNLNIKTENVDCKTESNLNIKTEEDVDRETESKANADERNFKKSNRKRKHNEENANKRDNRVAFISKEERVNECRKALHYLRAKNFDTLIIVAKYHPKCLLLALLEFLPNAMPFVVYFTHQEPLAECYVALREKNVATNLELTETWFRNVQVLPKRTHPEIVMSATGGFILRGLKVDSV